MIKRATGLLELDRGGTLVAVAENSGAGRVTVAAWGVAYEEQSLN